MEKQRVKKEALELSLKYGFVTPLTSMVVTKPPGENTQVIHKPREGEKPVLSGPQGVSPFSGQACKLYFNACASFCFVFNVFALYHQPFLIKTLAPSLPDYLSSAGMTPCL